MTMARLVGIKAHLFVQREMQPESATDWLTRSDMSWLIAEVDRLETLVEGLWAHREEHGADPEPHGCYICELLPERRWPDGDRGMVPDL